MATASIPKEPVSVSLTREEFDRFDKAERAIGSLLWILNHGQFDTVEIIPDLEALMKPHHSELAELGEQLEQRFKAGCASKAKK